MVDFRIMLVLLVVLVVTMVGLEWMQVANSSVSRDLVQAVVALDAKLAQLQTRVDAAAEAANQVQPNVLVLRQEANARADSVVAAVDELRRKLDWAQAEATRSTEAPVTLPPAQNSRHLAPAAGSLAPHGKRFHFIFSSDCRYPPKSHWQSVALLRSFFETQMQTAVLTEIVSCHDTTYHPYWFDQLTPLEQSRTRFWVAPTRNPHPITRDDYAPQNKPFGLRDWNLHVGPHDDDIVVLTDWDNIYVRPFPVEALTEVRDGFPQGALYGLGMGWATNVLADTVCPDWCPNKTEDERRAIGAIGPPHAWTAHDFRRMLPLWQNYTEWIRSVPEAREVGGWTSDMYGYMFTALRLGWRHTIHPHWMLSSSHNFEWNQNIRPPVVLHYCQTYRVGDWHFYKYDISFYDALACDFPLLAEPPRLVGNDTDVVQANTADAWIAHTLVMYINEAFVWYKERLCGPDWKGRSAPRWRAQSDERGGEHVNRTVMQPGP